MEPGKERGKREGTMTEPTERKEISRRPLTCHKGSEGGRTSIRRHTYGRRGGSHRSKNKKLIYFLPRGKGSNHDSS